ncbi:MAG: M20/M25/M40 family metallo-hydrolase [Candidatus Saccharimonadales bacterium]
MTKKQRSTKTTQSFSEFTGRLSAKWKLLTQPSKPALPNDSEHGKAELEDIFRQLIAIPTVTGNYEANHNALDYIERFLKKQGMHCKRHEWNGSESLVATTRTTKKPKVMLTAHLDVVPGDESLFELQEKDGKYYGRGVLDMKFAIAAYLQAVQDLPGNIRSYDFGIMITTDEEAGGVDGVARLAEAGYIPKICILPDGGLDWQIQLYSKGFLYLSIVAEGKAAHGARPWLGDNAVNRLVQIINESQKLFKDPGTDPEVKINTLNIGRITGGKAPNQVAEHAEMLFDIRVSSDSEGGRLLQEIEKICAHNNATVSVLVNGCATDFSLKDPVFAEFAALITEKTGVEVVGSRTPASSDIRYYIPHNVPCISVYPPGGSHHSQNEWIDKKGFYQFQDIIQTYLERTTKR